MDDGFKVTVETPQLVPAECWNYLCYETLFAGLYSPNPNPHINEWHKHNPPPGTVYNILPRLNHPSLIRRDDSRALLDSLHDLAPYDAELGAYIYRRYYHNEGTYAETEALFHGLLPFNTAAMARLADSVPDDPARYEALMSKAADLQPSFNFVIGDYFRRRHQDDLAAKYYETGRETADEVTATQYAEWQVHYYLRKGDTKMAAAVADNAGAVYSEYGLKAKAEFLEQTGDYAGAYDWYLKLKERYDNPGPLAGFCYRYKAKTGDDRYDVELMTDLTLLFPRGLEKKGLSDFQAAPPDGVLIAAGSDATREFGLSKGDVIVAVEGIRVHNYRQYVCAREFSPDLDMHLIVWRGGYKEIEASPPDHAFDDGARLVDYASD